MVNMCIATVTDKCQMEAAVRRSYTKHYFSDILTYTDIEHGKDEPIIYCNTIKRLGK